MSGSYLSCFAERSWFVCLTAELDLEILRIGFSKFYRELLVVLIFAWAFFAEGCSATFYILKEVFLTDCVMLSLEWDFERSRLALCDLPFLNSFSALAKFFTRSPVFKLTTGDVDVLRLLLFFLSISSRVLSRLLEMRFTLSLAFSFFEFLAFTTLIFGSRLSLVILLGWDKYVAESLPSFVSIVAFTAVLLKFRT